MFGLTRPGCEAPELLAVTGLFFLMFVIGAAYQVWRLRSQPPAVAAPA